MSPALVMAEPMMAISTPSAASPASWSGLMPPAMPMRVIYGNRALNARTWPTGSAVAPESTDVCRQ